MIATMAARESTAEQAVRRAREGAAEVKVVAPARDAAGFALAGVDVEAYTGAADARAALERAVADPGCAVLVLDAGLLPALPPRLARRLLEGDRPLVLALPMGRPEAGAERAVEALLRRVIGFEVKL